MKIRNLHSWALSPNEAVELQKKLSGKVLIQNPPPLIRQVAGADITTYRDSNKAHAGIIVMNFPELEIIESVNAEVLLTYPYIPGLLSFRESPALLAAFAKLKNKPDLIMIDGQGLSHPRRFGLACHIGLLLNRPTIGCAKSRLTGSHDEPGPDQGKTADLLDHHGHLIGSVVRTKNRVSPLYISVGYMITLESAIHYTLACCRGYRIPEPTRQAHLYVGRLRRENKYPALPAGRARSKASEKGRRPRLLSGQA